MSENIRKITKETISSQHKSCPICKGNNVDIMGMNAVMRFETPEKSITMPMYPIAYACTGCGYLMFFLEINVDLDKIEE